MSPKRLPDFIIAGAPRSGTTWLYSLLDRHPWVFLAKPVAPEPKFFLRDDLYAAGLDAYARLFEGAAPGQMAGEKSTNYLESPAAAARIHGDLPRIKLIFVLRDPVTRAYSNYLWSRKNGKETETFDKALELEDAREKAIDPSMRFARPHAYFSRGLYAELLAPYLALFPRDQLLFLTYESMVRDSGAFACSVHRFLGVTERPGDARSLGVINSAPGDDLGLPASARRRLELAYDEPNRRLRTILGAESPIWDYGA